MVACIIGLANFCDEEGHIVWRCLSKAGEVLYYTTRQLLDDLVSRNEP